MSDDYSRVLEILYSKEQRLREIAIFCNRSPSTFYRGSDLRGCDLTNQNLEGLNFDNADLRGAILNGITVTEGALNNALLDGKYNHLTDMYDSYLSDIDVYQISKMAIFAKFRPGIFDEVAEAMAITLKGAAKIFDISTSTLRRLRNGDAVSTDTLKSVWKNLKGHIEENPTFGEFSTIKNLINQPSLVFGEFEGDLFIPFTRSYVAECVDLVDQVNEAVNSRYADREGYFPWTIQPSNLRYYLRIYSGTFIPGDYSRLRVAIDDSDIPLFNVPNSGEESI